MIELFKRYYLIVLLLLVSGFAWAQKGTIRGTVIEDATGEPLFSVTAVIKGTTNGAITDFDGKFEIKADPGIYDLQVSFVSFKSITITGIEVKPDQVILIDQIRLQEAVEELEAVVVTAEVVRSTEAALMTVKRKSANLLDGISAASFRKIGDSDAASAAKRITGVSIEGGRYVYVRGLGDRYTKTLLNGMDVPGLDPDRNTLQMDIFPTAVLNNILVSKSFTPDQPADFTGGIVNIETKDIPDEKTMSAQVGLAYNPNMHFQSDYLTYQGGKTDWLGFDDGTRALHIDDSEVISRTEAITDRSTSDRFTAQMNDFSKTLGSMKQSSFMDYNLSYTFGNQVKKNIGTLGYNVALTYRNSTEYYEDAQYARYGIADSDPSETQLEQRELQRGDQGSNSVLAGGLLGVALKRSSSKYRFNILHLQNGQSKAGLFTYQGSDEGADFYGLQSNLEYSQRSLSNILLAGEHYFDDTNWKLDWKVSPTYSSIEDPDIRFVRYQTNETFDGDYEIGSGESGFPQRIWRSLSEVNLASRVDLTRKYEYKGEEGKFKFGVGNTYKTRDYSIRRFDVTVSMDDFTGNFDELFAEENLWDPNTNSGNSYAADFIPVNANFFESSITNNAFYVMNEFTPVPRLKTIIGVRGEDYTQLYTGRNANSNQVNNDLKVIDEFNLFPSASLIFGLTETQNIRAAYSRTIARFSFKEASFATIFDPLTGRTFLGALSEAEGASGELIWDGNITSTLIDNLDLRWEVYQRGGQNISVSGFYKVFHNAIEIAQSATADNNFQPRNVGDATVLGGEVEFRQRLTFVARSLQNFVLNGNLTVLDSRVEMTQEEFESRQRVSRTGETVSSTRDLQGQAPYLINAGIAYDNDQQGTEIGLYYNVQGETLTYTGIADRPDIYTVPFHGLNLTANKTLGKEDNMRLTLKVNNLLGDKREMVYKNYNAEDQFFQSLSPGRRISLSFNYSF